jgi:hypothetical protein
MNKPEIKLLSHLGLNAWGKAIFLVNYRDASNVVAENEIIDWCREIDEHYKWKYKKGGK